MKAAMLASLRRTGRPTSRLENRYGDRGDAAPDGRVGRDSWPERGSQVEPAASSIIEVAVVSILVSVRPGPCRSKRVAEAVEMPVITGIWTPADAW